MRKLIPIAIAAAAVAAAAAAGCGSSHRTASSTPTINVPKVKASGASYHPKIDPAQFTTQVTNKYWPMKPGTTWTYDGTKDGAPEHVVVTVKPATKTILGVKTVTIQDTVTINH